MFETECITCDCGIFVSVANKGKLSQDMHVDSSKHYKAVRFTFFLFIVLIKLKNKLLYLY